jgi:hypothetical protein
MIRVHRAHPEETARVLAFYRAEGCRAALQSLDTPVITEAVCIPYRRLRDFYSQIGFLEIDPTQAPPFLQDPELPAATAFFPRAVLYTGGGKGKNRPFPSKL